MTREVSEWIPFHHTCVGYTAPWWRPQIECSVCRLQYMKPECINLSAVIKPKARKTYSEEGSLR